MLSFIFGIVFKLQTCHCVMFDGLGLRFSGAMFDGLSLRVFGTPVHSLDVTD